MLPIQKGVLFFCMLTFYTNFTLSKGEKIMTEQTIRLLMP